MHKFSIKNFFFVLGNWCDPKIGKKVELLKLIIILMAQTDYWFIIYLLICCKSVCHSSLPAWSCPRLYKKKNLPKLYIQVKLHFFYHRFLKISWYIGFLHLIYVYSLAMLLLICISLILQTKGITSSSTVYFYLQQLKGGHVRQSLSDRLVLLYVQSSSWRRDLSFILEQSSNELQNSSGQPVQRILL